MKALRHNVAELQRENVTFELEAIDRMYFNAYVPQLTSAAGVASYFRNYKGHRFASTKDAADMSKAFKRNILDFAEANAIPIIRFSKGQRKDDVMQKRLRKFRGSEGVLFIGIAQEKATAPRTVRKRFGPGDGTIPWIDYTTALVNFYYFYAVDEDFGPFFIKFCSYFPYTSKLCLNGHEYLKRHLAQGELARLLQHTLGRVTWNGLWIKIYLRWPCCTAISGFLRKRAPAEFGRSPAISECPNRAHNGNSI